MSLRETLDTCYLCWFSKPKAERPIFRFLKTNRSRAILELGLSSEERTLSLIRLAQRMSPGQEIRYFGIDLFDARPSQLPRLTLKQIHQATQRSGAQSRLIPGDAVSGFHRCAQQIQRVDLVIVSADQDAEALAKTWLSLSRALSPHGRIFQARGTSSMAVESMELLTAQRVEQLAAQSQKSRRAA